MKLSQLTTDQTADALVTIAPEIETLLSDDALVEMCTNIKTPSGKVSGVFGAAQTIKILGYLLKEHRIATYRIVAAINQTSPEKIGNQMMMETIKQALELIFDQELMSFFTSLGQSVRESA